METLEHREEVLLLLARDHLRREPMKIGELWCQDKRELQHRRVRRVAAAVVCSYQKVIKCGKYMKPKTTTSYLSRVP